MKKVLILLLCLSNIDSQSQQFNDSIIKCNEHIGKYRKNFTFPSNLKSRTSGWVQKNEYSDDFNGPLLDTTKWSVYNNYCHTMSPKAFFVNSPNNVFIEDSILKLKAKLLPYSLPCTNPNYDTTIFYPYTSGFVISNFSFRYGYVEIMCNLPTDLGLNPCLWMYGDSPERDDEIDVFEKDLSENSNKVLLQNFYRGAHHPPQHKTSQQFTFTTPFVGINRIFAVEWLPEEINYYINGELISSIKHTNNPMEVDTRNYFTCSDFINAISMKFLISLSVNKNIEPGSDPEETYDILYIKAFKLRDGDTTDFWPSSFNLLMPNMLKVNRTFRLGGDGKSAIVPPNINFTAWAKDSVMLYKGFVANGTSFTARVIKGASELYIPQLLEE